MNRTMWPALLLGAGWSAVGLTAPADDPKPAPAPAPELAGYKSLREASTREVAAPRAGLGRTGYLGVSLARDDKGKLVVDEVQPDSPASKAGIAKGDVVDRLDGEPVRLPEAFRESIQAKEPGDLAKLDLLRGGQSVEARATLGATSKPRTINPQDRAYLGIALGQPGGSEETGIPIDQVAPGSPAEAAGFKAGDRILQVDGIDFTSAQRLTEILVEKKPGDTFEVLVRRGKEDLTFKPRLAPESERPQNAAPGRPGAGAVGRGTLAIPIWTKPEFRLAVVGIEYPDVKHNAKVSNGDWEEALLGEGTYHAKKDAADREVHGSLNDYFMEQSNGHFRIKGKVFDWVEVSKKRNDYVLGSGTTNITAVVVEALDKVAARDGKDCFNDYDGFLVLYAGEPIRGNRGGVYAPHAGMIRNFQAKRWPYLIVPEGATRPTPVGGMVKEFAQMLGLPDLAARTEDRGSEGLGAWSALSSPTVRSPRPQHLDAWAKEKLGWIKPTVVDPAVRQKLILAPIETSGECLKVLVRPDASEYFLLENRKKTGFDEDLPAEGLLIWRVVKGRPILEESHGVEGPTGPTVHLDDVPYPSPANHAFTPETTPSSRSPLGGGWPVSITNIRRLPDGRIALQVGYEYR